MDRIQAWLLRFIQSWSIQQRQQKSNLSNSSIRLDQKNMLWFYESASTISWSNGRFHSGDQKRKHLLHKQLAWNINMDAVSLKQQYGPRDVMWKFTIGNYPIRHYFRLIQAHNFLN